MSVDRPGRRPDRTQFVVGWAFWLPTAVLLPLAFGWWGVALSGLALAFLTSVVTERWIVHSLLLPGRTHWDDVRYVVVRGEDWAAKAVIDAEAGGGIVMGSYRFTRRGVVRALSRVFPQGTVLYVPVEWPDPLRSLAATHFELADEKPNPVGEG